MRSAATVLMLLSLACYREAAEVSQNAPSEATTVAEGATAPASNTMNPPIPQEQDRPSASPTPALPTQDVQLIEYAIRMPDTLAAGRVAFNVQNAGKEDHGLEIEGNGVHQSTEVLKRGNSSALEVDLKPGTYTVYCPVKGHKERGMSRTITVQ